MVQVWTSVLPFFLRGELLLVLTRPTLLQMDAAAAEFFGTSEKGRPQILRDVSLSNVHQKLGKLAI